MITFERHGKIVRASIETDMHANYCFDLACTDEQYAYLLRQHFNNKLYREIQRIRSEAYVQGYDDHKKRKPKKTWFSGLFNT